MANFLQDQILESESDLAICWLGNVSWIIGGQGRLIAFDLDLDHELRLQPSPIPTRDIASVLDVLFITHEHGDHFNAETSTILAQNGKCTFVLPANCVGKAKSIGIPDSRIVIAHPGTEFDIFNMNVHPLHALHGDKMHAVYRHANFEDCGYVITLSGKRLMQPGDSVLLQEHLETKNIDILFVSPTEHNMHIEDSVTLIRTLNPDYIFPQHFDTYHQNDQNTFWTQGFPDKVRHALPLSLQKKYHKIPQGVVYFIW